MQYCSSGSDLTLIHIALDVGIPLLFETHSSKFSKAILILKYMLFSNCTCICCPRRCTFTILECFLIYIYLQYSIPQQRHRFYCFCHENKVWYWLPFVIMPPPLERIETATLASYPSAAEDWYSS